MNVIQKSNWKIDVLKKLQGVKPGEMTVMMSGRRVGKSAFSDQALKRLMDDIWYSPLQKIVLSENRVHGARYYCAEPVGGNWREMEAWCFEQFGDVGNNIGWDESETPKCHRWYMNNRKFWFRDDQDRMVFILKWQ